MKKSIFLILITILPFLIYNCSKDSELNPLSTANEELGTLQFNFKQETPEVHSGKVTITRGSKSYTKPIVIENNYGSVTFYRINVGSWNISVLLYDADGDPIYDGSATALVKRDELTVVNIVVRRISGNLQVNVIVPELLLWNRLGSATEVSNSEVGPGLVYNQSGTGIGFPTAVFGHGVWLDNTTGGKYCLKLLDQSTVLNPDRGCVELWYWQADAPIAYSYGVYRIWNGPWSSGDNNNGISISVGDPQPAPPAYSGLLFDFMVSFGNTGNNRNRVFLKTSSRDQVTEFNNKWTHLAFVWDRNASDEVLKVYVDGVKQTIVANGSETSLPAWVYSTNGGFDNSHAYWGNISSGPADIGSGQDSNYSRKFIIDNLKVWSAPKSDFSDRFIE